MAREQHLEIFAVIPDQLSHCSLLSEADDKIMGHLLAVRCRQHTEGG